MLIRKLIPSVYINRVACIEQSRIQPTRHEVINKLISKINLGIKNECFKQLSDKISYTFSNTKNSTSRLILHSPQQIQSLHVRSLKKRLLTNEKQWQVIRQKNQKYKVSLVGLPNCGKSSLFNCIVGERLAIVDKQYGMTRDRREFNILQGMVTVVDTPGVQVNLLTKNHKNLQQGDDGYNQAQLKQDIFQQTMTAIDQSDMVLFIIDAKKQTISQAQIVLAKYLKAFNSQSQKDQINKKCQILIVCNKCDGMNWDQNDLLNQIYCKIPIVEEITDGLTQQQKDNIFYTSAEDGTGIFQILQYINKRIPPQMKQANQALRKQRRDKFQKLIKKMKAQIKQLNVKHAPTKEQKQEKQKSEEENQQEQQVKLKEQDRVAGSNPHKKPQKRLARLKIREWQNDFRLLNPNPQQNQQLDQQNYQDFFIRPQQAFSANSRGVQMKNLKLKHSIKICFIGRPNVGKSSLINEIIGDQKMIVSEVPHTTRDSLTTKILYKNRKIQIVDTAGLNTPRFEENQDQFLRKVQYSTMLHVRQAHLVCYVMDAFNAFRVDDFVLINRVIEEGRPIIIVVNKWEAIKEQYKNKARQYLMTQLDKNLGQLHGHPIVFVSAKMALNIDQMMDKIITTYDKWNKRISTGLLNNWLQKFKKLDNMPKDAQTTLKINYLIQARVRPPHYIFFVNNKMIFKANYMRFLLKNMAQQFQLDGIPLRHTLRSTNNKQNEKPFRKKQTTIPNRKTKVQQKMQQLKKKYGDFTI